MAGDIKDITSKTLSMYSDPKYIVHKGIDDVIGYLHLTYKVIPEDVEELREFMTDLYHLDPTKFDNNI